MAEQEEERVQTGVRIPASYLDRADRLAEAINQSPEQIGTATRSDVMRTALRLGLDALESQYGLEDQAKK